MQKERPRRNDLVLSTFSALDVVGAIGAIVAFLGFAVRVLLGWVIGG